MRGVSCGLCSSAVLLVGTMLRVCSQLFFLCGRAQVLLFLRGDFFPGDVGGHFFKVDFEGDIFEGHHLEGDFSRDYLEGDFLEVNSTNFFVQAQRSGEDEREAGVRARRHTPLTSIFFLHFGGIP